MWYLYILKCGDDSLYTGITNDIAKRFKKHTTLRGARYTKSHGATKIVYKEEHLTRSKALKREAEIKSWTRGRKLELITTQNSL